MTTTQTQHQGAEFIYILRVARRSAELQPTLVQVKVKQRLDVTYTLLIMRFHMQPWNGTLTLLDVRSTSAGIPPRKTCCKLTGWSLGRDVSLLASSSTWTAKDLRGRPSAK